MELAVIHTHLKREDFENKINYVDVLSRWEIPVSCPITKCNMQMPSSYLMAHYINMHRFHKSRFVTAFSGEKCIFQVNPFTLRPRGSICVGMIAFGGERDGIFIYRFNNVTAEETDAENISAHIPVFVMAARNKDINFDRVKPRRYAYFDDDVKVTKNYLFWLVTLQKSFFGECEIVLNDKDHNVVCSNNVKVRNLISKQKPSDIIKEEGTSLFVSKEEFNRITDDNQRNLFVEVTLKSNDLLKKK